MIAAASVVFSGFFVMATDSCGWHECDESRLGWAYGWTWGGVVVAALVALVGIVVANRRGRPMWVWPAVALVVVIGTFAIGVHVAGSVVTG